PTKLILPSEFADRPKDITFLLDELAKMNQEGDLKDKINVNQVNVIGHSFGGYTALALAGGEIDLDNLRKFCQSYNPLDKSGADWLQCIATDLPGKNYNFKDTRVTQIIALNPAVGQGFTNDGLSKIKIPTLMLTGTDDTLTPAVSHQLQPFRQLGGKKYLLTAIGGTHLSVLDPDVLDPDFILTVPKELLGEKALPIRKATQGVILAFIKQQTKDANIYQSFLTPAYPQSLSTKDMPLRFNSDLPTAVTSWLNMMDSSEKPE
ncbi:MAG TPA: dienelactone hydrolase, partial [Allocoleopsis sp.]